MSRLRGRQNEATPLVQLFCSIGDDAVRESSLLVVVMVAISSVAYADYADLVLGDGPAAYWQLDDAIETELLETTDIIAPGEYEDIGGLLLEWSLAGRSHAGGSDLLAVCSDVPVCVG